MTHWLAEGTERKCSDIRGENGPWKIYSEKIP